ncbi:FtsX-like permease family protein [Kitasatospora sp. NPDC057936]|uniref:FtsX-like permease family protein n=1 Tax=Kitasatospora sp. NPDC057936 TaxID=3346283 RepID=UPI0036DCF74E
MLRAAWRTVRAHKSRMGLTALAVAVGVAFVTGILLVTATVSDALTGASRQTYAHTDVVVRPDTGSVGAPSDLGEAELQRVRGLPETGRVIPAVSGYTALGCPDGRSADRGGPAVGAGYGGSDPRYSFTGGRPPTGGDEIAVDEAAAARCGYRVGDAAWISVDGPGLTARISGVFTTRAEPAVTDGGSVVLFDTATAQQHFTGPGRYSEFHVKAAPGATAERLRQATKQAVPGATVLTADVLTRDRALRAENQVSSLRTTLLSFAAVALFVSCFLIANTFGMLVAQRTREVGLLRAIGASRRQVGRLVLAEAFLVGLAGSLVGVAAGVGVGEVLRPIAGGLGKGGPLPTGDALSLPAYALLVPLATGVLTTVVAAWLPARRAGRIAPLAALRVAEAPLREGVGRRRVLAGVVLAAGGAAGLLSGASSDRIQEGAPVLALGAVLAAGSLLALMPTLVGPLLAVVRPLLGRAGIGARLAERNSASNPRRVSAPAASLVIGVSLVTTLTVVAAGGLAAADAAGAHVLKADYVVSMRSLDAQSAVVERTLAASAEVAAVAALREVELTVDGVRAFGLALPSNAVRDMLRLRMSGGAADIGAGNVLVPAGYGRAVGSTVHARLVDGRAAELTVAGVYEPNALVSGFLVDAAAFPVDAFPVGAVPVAASPAGAVRSVLVRTRDHPSPGLRRTLAHALGDSPALRIDSSDDLARAAADDTDRMLDLLYALLGLSIGVALLGVVNTLALSVTERRREIGMLRAIGLTRAGVRAMVRAEALIIAVLGGALGLALGLLVGWASGEAIARHTPGFRHSVPVLRLAVLLAAAAGAGLLASLWPARRAARTPVLAAIGTE